MCCSRTIIVVDLASANILYGSTLAAACCFASLQRNCDAQPSIQAYNSTDGFRKRLEALSAVEYSDGGPVHFLVNFFATNLRDQLVQGRDGNLVGSFVNKVRILACVQYCCHRDVIVLR